MSDAKLHDRSSLWALPGYLGVWAGLYVCGALLAMHVLFERPVNPIAATGVFLLTVSVYLLDRVKPADRMVDPADAVAHPRRHALMERHARKARWATFLLASAAFALFVLVHPLLGAMAPMAHSGMLIYGTIRGKPDAPRPKDRLIVKNLAVGVSITGLALVVFILEVQAVIAMEPLIGAAGFLLLHVFTDAMLCDLDDIEADNTFSTRTIPNTLGVRATWIIAIALNVAAAAWLLLWWRIDDRPLLAPAVVAGALLITTAGLALVRPRVVRDLVDLKLPIVAGAAWAVLIAMNEWSAS